MSYSALVAQAVPTRAHRDVIKDILGPDLVFVILTMTKDAQRKRIHARHGEGEEMKGLVDMMMKIGDIYEITADNEVNAVDVTITPDMTPEDVADAVIERVKRMK